MMPLHDASANYAADQYPFDGTDPNAVISNRQAVIAAFKAGYEFALSALRDTNPADGWWCSRCGAACERHRPQDADSGTRVDTNPDKDAEPEWEYGIPGGTP